jgi:pyridinium-3,5-bisthiocarboxylic acid mononucleotide nickel chelatase
VHFLEGCLKLIYFDCFSGISGDMVLGALIDAGLNFKAWKSEMEGLGLSGYTLTKRKVTRGGLAGTKLTVKASDGHPHRGLAHITGLIKGSKIDKAAKKDAVRIFNRLAEAEAGAHGVAVEKIHFHEVGAVDSIVDIVGASVALRIMGAQRICSSALNLGSGTVKCAHGTLPVPAPATANLVRGFPAYSSDIRHELTTPTGAAIVTTLASSFGPMPPMRVTSVGYGAGGREIPGFSNLLRVFVGEQDEDYEHDTAELIETNIDDMDPRIYEHVMERLLGAGALDVWLTPVIMKKSRPAVTLSVLAGPGSAAALSDILLRETTTFGVRVSRVEREKLARRFTEVITAHGTVRVKMGMAGGRTLKAVPEYEDVKAVAKKSGRPIKVIIKEVERLL